jgi:hypothetical protein
MRAAILLLALAAACGCSSDEPQAVETRPEQPAPESDVLEQRLSAIDSPRTVEAPCDEIARLEALRVDALRRYTQQHPDVIRVTQEIARVRDSAPTDEVCGAQSVIPNQGED